MSVKKAPKPASLLRKPISEKAFRNSFLALLEIEKDQAFFAASFELKDGYYFLKDGLDRDSMVRLNKLAKAAKANRGFLKAGRLVVLAVLAAAALVFGLFFLDPLVARGAEKGLEAAFGAKAEISGLRLSLLDMRVSLESLRVADQDEPMKNLFETGRMEFALSPAALFRGKVDIERASAASIALGTPRQSSGALAKAAPEPKQEKKADAGPPLIDFAAFDAKALLESQKGSLKSAAAYSAAAEAYEASAEAWTAKVADGTKALGKLQGDAKSLLGTDPGSLKSPDAVAKAVSDAKRLAGGAKDAAAQADAAASAAKADLAKARELERAAADAYKADLAKLKTFIDPRSGAAAQALAPTVREMLSAQAERYVYYGSKALAAARKLSAEPKSKNKDKKPSFRGRDAEYPAVAYPRFRIGLLEASFKDGGKTWAVELRDLSSDPDLQTRPTTLKVSVSAGDSRSAAEIVADLRPSSPDAFSAKLSGSKLPVDLGGSLGKVGIKGFKASAAFAADFHGAKTGALAGAGTLNFTDCSVQGASGVLGSGIADAVAKAKSVDARIDYRKEAGADARFGVDTNLDSLLAAALRASAERYAQKSAADLEAALAAYAGGGPASKIASKDDFERLAGAAAGNKEATAKLKASLDSKAGDFEKQAKKLGDGAAKDAGKKLKSAIKL